jgi:hypothetical protein
MAHFGHPLGSPTDKSRATDDADGDGKTNLQEFRTGTDPKNGSSLFHLLTPMISGADNLINLPTVNGFVYRIDFASDLLSPSHWRTLTDQIQGTGGTITISDPGAGTQPQRYYRAVVLP